MAKMFGFLVRSVLWMLTHTLYRITIAGREHIPSRGPALIISNHMSMIDGALVGASIDRPVRFLVYGPHFRLPWLQWFLRYLHAIPVTAGNRKEVLRALERAHAELAAGHVVCIFAEGAVSRTGNLLPFKRGFERIVDGLDVPVIPVYLDRVWGSIFSFKGGKFFWKIPERLPYPVTVQIGKPLPSTVKASEARLAVLELGAEALSRRRPDTHLLHTEYMRSAKRRWRHPALADSTGQELTHGRTLVGAILFARILRRRTPDQRMVGLLLPSSVGGALANIAVLMAGRIPVNLNFTVGKEALEAAIAQAGIRTIVTSRKFLAKASLPELPGMVFLEKLREEIGQGAKIAALLQARLLPVWWLRRRLGGNAKSDALATVIFSSGSTGVPKGVMITHANILSNVDSLAQIFRMETSDCFIGVLPFFHSFGLTGTLWFPLLQGASVAYHPNPMDAKTIGELAGKYQAKMLISTPTFCASYIRKCEPEQFKHLRYAIVGAERLREPVATAFKAKFGIDLLEGYGCTEMAPVVAVNVPDVQDGHERQRGTRIGSVGHPLPGVAAKIVDVDTGEGPLFDREGLLLVKGPNRMLGYLGDPAKTADVNRDGWYVTGDIARIDDAGFVEITDRLSRFSKIGGEMVPHMRIEEQIQTFLADGCTAVVTAVPDPSKGERLVVFYTDPALTPQQLWERLCQTELPRLWVPKRDDFNLTDSIPTLGTGKLDLRAVRQLALARVGSAA